MPSEAIGGARLGVVAGDVLALRGAGLAAAETWALLCQAAQALQDLFLSNGGVVGGSRMGPVVTPHTLELTARGRVTLQLAPPETARAYLPPEYRPGRIYSDTDSEKMWMYSLGRALLDTTPRVAALTGTVSVSPSSALQSVLAAMTEPDPHRRASLMNLLDVISEYCRTRLQSKPFTHIVMDMYREVTRSAQYAARKRAATAATFQQPQQLALPSQQQHQQRHQPTSSQSHGNQQQEQQQQQQHQSSAIYTSRYQVKGALFKAQSRNSRSHPNLLSLSGGERSLGDAKPEFQSQLNIQTIQGASGVHHARTSSQPEYGGHDGAGGSGVGLQHTRSSNNLLMIAAGQNVENIGNIYSDPIYALPVKPFLSSQDVRVNGMSAKQIQRTETCVQRSRINNTRNGVSSQPNITHLTQLPNVTSRKDDAYPKIVKNMGVKSLHQRQYSNPQIPSRNQDANFRHSSQPNVASTQLQIYSANTNQQQNPTSSMKVPSPGVVPPKPPRIITTLKRTAPVSTSDVESSGPPVKPPRSAIKNGPRARRGKAVQRAPSRLYRAIGGPMRCFNKTQCVGPEFVVRANQPAKQLSVGDIKTGSIGRIIVILLTGQRLEVTCDSQRVTAGELFQAIVQAEGLDENFTLGLAALLAGDFAMLPPDTKLNKVAPPGWLNNGKNKGLLGLPTSFMLYLRLRFFLPSLRGIRSWISKHLLYLQIRRCILEQQLICPLPQLINLTGLALQAEFGNYSINEHGCGDYFLLEHYVPESLILNQDQNEQSQIPGGAEALRVQLHQAHRDRRGLDANKAEEMFIAHAQALPDYGAHYYIATVDSKELEKILARLEKDVEITTPEKNYNENENLYELDGSSEYPIYGKIDFPRVSSSEDIRRIFYRDEKKMRLSKSASHNEDIYAIPKKPVKIPRIEANNNKVGKSKKSESNVWLAVHAQGLKIFGRGGRPRERTELIRFQWRDIQTLSYSKSCLVVHSRVNGKRCKFKLRMDHRKSYFAFKLTSLHHQFYLKLRSELTSLQGLATDFGVPLIVEPNSPPPKVKPDNGKTKISIASTVKKQKNLKYPMQLEEYQNKENENPQKETHQPPNSKTAGSEPICYTPEEDALYAQVHTRLEPEGESRDTEDESDRGHMGRNEANPENVEQGKSIQDNKLYSYPNLRQPSENGCIYSLPHTVSPTNLNKEQSQKSDKPEELYAAINKSGFPKKTEFPVPEEVWDVSDMKKTLHKVKTSSLPNYGTPKQMSGFRTPSLPRRLGVKMGTRVIYSSLVQRDLVLADELESLSLKSDTASSIQSASAQSTESPMPEAYVLNADIRTNDETFRVPEDESMSASLAARLEELSFAEERILHTIKLERGHGGSIGLQVTEGNDGGVYVQAVSVGGSADMAGNVNKGDRIVAINGQSLLNLRYEEALKMLQSSSETVELVLSQFTTSQNLGPRLNREPDAIENNYMHNIRFDVFSEADTSIMTTKWFTHKTPDISSVQNTSSAYSSAPSSAMGNHNPKELSTPPPVPPRRRKRRNELKTSSSKGTSAPESSWKSEHKLRLPPPPPPPPTVNSRGRKTPFVTNRRSRSITSYKPEADNVPSGCEDAATCTDFHADETAKSLLVDVSRDGAKDKDDLYLAPNPTDSLELTKNNQIKEPEVHRGHTRRLSNNKMDKYPSLFFTLQDFENVMADSEGNFSQTSVADNLQERSEVTLLGHSLDGDNSEEVCFRITTTNFPFEKCLGGWDRGNFENKNFDADIQNVDHFVFEDYIDRTKRAGRIKQPESFLFADDTFENNNLDSMSTERTATRVRFVVDSPSTSTPDGELTEEKQTFDSLLNIDSILADDFGNKDEPVTLTKNGEIEIEENFNETVEFPKADEFGEIPFSSLLSANGADVNNALLAVNSDVNLSTEVSGPNNYPESPDNMHRVFTVTACIETLPNNSSKQIIETNQNVFPIVNENHVSDFARDDLRDDLSLKRLKDKNSPQKDRIKNEMSVLHEIVQEPEYFLRNNKNVQRERDVTAEKERITISDIPRGESKKRQIHLKDNLYSVKKNKPSIKLVEKRKIFIDESLQDFINNEEDMEWRDSSDEDEIDVKSGKIEFSTKQETRPKEVYNKNMEKSARLESPIDIHKVECLSARTNDITSENDMKTKKAINEKLVAVSTRRNSFLEDMLKDEILQAPCKIIATHPKIPPRSSLTREIPKEVKSTTKVTSPGVSNDQKEPELPKVNKEEKYPEVKNHQEGKKSSCEVKSDVLSELLCNFSAIKLKSIGNNEAKASVGMVDNKAEGLTPSSDSTPTDIKDPCVDSNNIDSNAVKCKIIEEPIVDTRSRDKSHDGDAASSEKTDELIDKCVNSSARAKGPEVAVSTVDVDRNNRIDECAIARKAPLTQCNNTDNNAMTPVAVSSDQSRDVVSITPGSVRSFVKYYEIQRETSKHSKSNDSEPVARPVTMYRKQMDRWTKNEECDQRRIKKKIVENKAQYNGTEVSKDHVKNDDNKSDSDSVIVKEIDNDIRYTVIARKIVRRDANTLSLKSNSDLHRSAGNVIGKGSCFKMVDPSKSECKKTVQFDSGCTVIRLNSYEYDEVLEDPNKVEWMRNKMTMMKEPVEKDPREAASNAVQGRLFGSRVELEEETDRLMSHPVDGNSLQIEKPTEIEAEDDTRKSGIARLVPKSTNHLSQTHVFYCTV